MRLLTARIRNYKCFNSTEKVKFEPGLNLVVGANNSGKSTFLDALTPNCSPLAHRTLTTVPNASLNLHTPTEIDLSFECKQGDPIAWATSNGTTVSFAMPQEVAGSDGDRDVALSIIRRILAASELFVSNSGTMRPKSFYVDMEEPPSQLDQRTMIPVRLGPDDSHEVFMGQREVRHFSTDPLSELICSGLKSRIFRFRAERFSIGKTSFGKQVRLASDASNLPMMIDSLKSSRYKQVEYTKAINSILPNIEDVTTENVDSDVEIKIWPQGLKAETGRSDLAISLTEAGTGIGQILAIVYQAMFGDEASIILIDEIQSFLHPSAVRNLIEFLKQHSRHQYIISTHSSLVVSICQNAAVFSCRIENMVGSVFPLSPAMHSHQLMILEDLGSSPADVFGADAILWVEGPSEKHCFPAILRHFYPNLLYGCSILPLVSTSDLMGARRKAREVAIGIYKSLSNASTVFPNKTKFFLDREGAAADQLREYSSYPIAFTRGYMLESYLINAQAIADMLNEHGERAWPERSVTQVAEQLRQCNNHTDVNFESDHASRILDDAITALTEGKLLMSKPERALSLVERILEGDPQALQGLADELAVHLRSW